MGWNWISSSEGKTDLHLLGNKVLWRIFRPMSHEVTVTEKSKLKDVRDFIIHK
jgi:hypothetical protein